MKIAQLNLYDIDAIKARVLADFLNRLADLEEAGAAKPAANGADPAPNGAGSAPNGADPAPNGSPVSTVTVDMPATAEEPASAAAAEDPAPRRTRGKGKPKDAAAPEGVTAINTAADAARADALGDFIIYNTDGTKRAGFSHADTAAELLVKLSTLASTVEELWKFQKVNTPTVDRLSAEQRDSVIGAFKHKLGELNAAESAAAKAEAAASLGTDTAALDDVFGAQEPPPAVFSRDDVRNALMLLNKAKGAAVLLELLDNFSAKRVADIAEADFAAVMAAISAL